MSGPAATGSGSLQPAAGDALFGATSFTHLVSVFALPSPWEPSTQSPEIRINTQVLVYREHGGGYDDFFVIYMQDGWASPGDPLYDTELARGWFQCRLDQSVAPVAPSGRPYDPASAYIAFNSPASVDQTTDVQKMVVDSWSKSISVGSSSDGGSSVSVSHEESTQLWYSATTPIDDWGLQEKTDPKTSKAAWTWHQQAVFDLLERDVGHFSEWYGTCYDAAHHPLPPPSLSRSTLQFHTTTAWRFGLNLVSGNALPVVFGCRLTGEYAVLSGPGGAPGVKDRRGFFRAGEAVWSSPTIDLVAITSSGSRGTAAS